jgi:hypothetical protein
MVADTVRLVTVACSVVPLGLKSLESTEPELIPLERRASFNSLVIAFLTFFSLSLLMTSASALLTEAKLSDCRMDPLRVTGFILRLLPATASVGIGF